MASGKQLARRGSTTVAAPDADSNLRQTIQEALHAYELAVATRLKTKREAAAIHSQDLGFVAELEQRASRERAHDNQAGQDVAAVEATRIGMLVRLASDTEEAAARLLESSALAHIRGVGDALAGAVQPHTVTDEQAAAAFTAAQKAAIELRAALLKLAAAHRENRDWESARDILIPFQSMAGPLHDEATALLYAIYLEQAAAANTNSNWEQASMLVESALGLFPDGLKTDPALSDQFLRAIRQLVEAAMVADRRDDAERHLAIARQKLGPDHPELQQWTHRQILGWAGGLATCLQEFGGHSQSVEHMAFSSDGEHLVSVDGRQIKRWRSPRTGSGRLVATFVAQGAYHILGGALLALTSDGAMFSTDDGTLVRTLAGAVAGSVTSLASSQDGSTVARTIREQESSRRVNLERDDGYMPVGPSGHGQADPFDYELLTPFRVGHGIPRRVIEDAIHSEPPRPVQYSNMRYRSAAIRFVESILISDSQTGNAHSSIVVAPKALILDIALSSSADFVAWLHPVGQVMITDIATRVIRHTFQAVKSQSSYDTITISPRDQIIAIAQVQSVSSYGQSKLTAWNVFSGGQVCSWDLAGLVGGIAISPDERLIAAINTKGDITLYDLRAQSPLPAVGNHGTTEFPCIAFSPDGSLLATSGDRTIKIWGVP